MKSKFILIIALLVLFTSCGTTIVSVSDKSRQYSIYIDKELKGINEVKITRSGLPQHKVVEIKDGKGNLIAREKISRDLNAIKFIVGFLYLWPLWFSSWHYDKNIEIYISKPQNDAGGNWEIDKKKSAWD